jgi:predicted metal-binding membrane protein
MSMPIAMAAMMAPTAVPFFAAFARDVKRPAPVAIVVLIYVTVWALIGAAAGQLMTVVMPPSSQLLAGAAIAFGVGYAAMPWTRWARDRCSEMCRPTTHRHAFADGARYAACCVMCSGGLMAALVVLGMSNVRLMAVVALAMLVYKVI